jgi:hypothetical protein
MTQKEISQDPRAEDNSKPTVTISSRSTPVNELFYSEHQNSLRRFLVNELIKQSKNVEVKRDLVERTQLVIDPSVIRTSTQHTTRVFSSRSVGA